MVSYYYKFLLNSKKLIPKVSLGDGYKRRTHTARGGGVFVKSVHRSMLSENKKPHLCSKIISVHNFLEQKCGFFIFT